MSIAFSAPAAYAKSPPRAETKMSKIGGPEEVPLPPDVPVGVTESERSVPQTSDRSMMLFSPFIAKCARTPIVMMRAKENPLKTINRPE